MTTIQIGSNTYDVYADRAIAEDYLAAALHATVWATATDLKKDQALITATRILDRQIWRGVKTSDSQPNEFPRDDMEIDGVDDGVTPQDIIDAACEIAELLLEGSDLQTTQNQSNKISFAGAGTARVSFFRGAEGIATRFPQIVQELVGKYLQTGSASLGFEAYDISNCATDAEFDVNG